MNSRRTSNSKVSAAELMVSKYLKSDTDTKLPDETLHEKTRKTSYGANKTKHIKSAKKHFTENRNKRNTKPGKWKTIQEVNQ